ncbi:MAG: hypothetical protein US75_C0012G0014 [Candidatus Woesebacteria bacterium GW2011_GWC1_38_13]|uniref:Uncharacterized protein n=3 Tax=Candidatus Woeseibacteriota TaxID=1752722 RepID=A0A0G0KW00_9BACT|nr:MAG: hypothetical protein US67_C0066G0007 [Candidatus Woesebacteria bacterium GW2011_GWD1_38_10]KKQ55871.1 MAG: hypothetical protein US75_C0012G0014 [Candidatus Woesebacteria bacterium GW2011_GWC1_38_13]KKQ83002.1 MAG: hypothetical protein UT06_C0030G0006 [Candidatus Woesebacteria bacterium GW2011_GWA1_38_8]
MDKNEKPVGLNVNIDPIRTPILYADAIRVNTNENGVVMDVAQTIAGTPQAVVVSRIGLSKEHAEKLAKAIIEQISKQGIFVTSKAKIIN